MLKHVWVEKSITKVSIEELQAYLGFMIIKGIVKLPSLYDYLKNDPYYYYAPIADQISRDRFMDISRYLHFVDNAMLALPGTPQYARLGKVRPILEFLNNKLITLYNPNRDNSIDEAMITFKGRSAMKQYVPKSLSREDLKFRSGLIVTIGLYVNTKYTVERRRDQKQD